MMNRIGFMTLICSVASLAFLPATYAEPPEITYIFPAGGQRGTSVPVRIGGLYLHESARLHLDDQSIKTPPRIERTETIWFEGPVIPQPLSQKAEDYPKDYASEFQITKDATLGVRRLSASTSQGISSPLKFIVGDLPEVVEEEFDGEPVAVPVKLPVTINGRIFPREDVDLWEFAAKKGETITCEVNSARMGTPLDARLEILNAQGARIAEDFDALGMDARVRFTAKETGMYQVRIQDLNSGGLQNYVYRLTIVSGGFVDSVYPLGGKRGTSLDLKCTGTNLSTPQEKITLPKTGDWYRFRPQSAQTTAFGLLLDLDDHPEYVEEKKPPEPLTFPCVMNGRILKNGEQDEWTFSAKAGESWNLEVLAARLGSPLDSVLTIWNAEGKQMVKSDDMTGGQTDSQLIFRVAQDGEYRVRIEDRLASRSGPDFSYRIKAVTGNVKQNPAGFRLTWPKETISVEQGKSTPVTIAIQSLGGFREPITLSVENLPEGVTVAGLELKRGAGKAKLSFDATESAKTGQFPIRLIGTAKAGKEPDAAEIKVVAQSAREPGEPVCETIPLAVAVPTPFKFVGVFESKFAPQGAVHLRKYTIERGDYKGPITIQLSDRQVRHLQGVSGPTIVVPPGETEFEYPAHLPPWLVVGRTSRTQIMAVAEVKDAAGQKHKVCYTSGAQNDQIIVLTDPGQLSLKCDQASVRAIPGGKISVTVRVNAAMELKNSISVKLVSPDHIHGVKAEPVTIAAGQHEAQLQLQFSEIDGPLNMPVKLEATTIDPRGYPVVAETFLEIVGDFAN